MHPKFTPSSVPPSIDSSSQQAYLFTMATSSQMSKKRKFIADGVFQAELGEFLWVIRNVEGVKLISVAIDPSFIPARSSFYITNHTLISSLAHFYVLTLCSMPLIPLATLAALALLV